jgi:two-component system sensor histidine kinase AgrC
MRLLGMDTDVFNNTAAFDAMFYITSACGIVITGFVYLIKWLLKKHVNADIFNHRAIHVLLFNAGAALIYIYIHSGTHAIIFDRDFSIITRADIAFFLLFASNIVTFILILRYISRENAVQAEIIQREASRQYINTLEESYRALRTIKHDYVNILTSFKLYIDGNDMAGLQKYYYGELAEVNKEILNQNRLMDDLQNIQPNEIKSILLYKCAEAARLGATVHIEAREEIKGFGISTAILCQILGILLDNAIEALALCEEKTLRVAVFTNPKSKTLIVQNTWNNADLPLNKIFDLGFSTKGENRGVGLHTLRNYTDSIAPKPASNFSPKFLTWRTTPHVRYLPLRGRRKTTRHRQSHY